MVHLAMKIKEEKVKEKKKEIGTAHGKYRQLLQGEHENLGEGQWDRVLYSKILDKMVLFEMKCGCFE